MTEWLFFAALIALFAWLFPPPDGWIDYIISCPFWHDPT